MVNKDTDPSIDKFIEQVLITEHQINSFNLIINLVLKGAWNILYDESTFELEPYYL